MNEFEFGFVCSAHDDFEQVAYDFYESMDGVIAMRDGQIFVTVEVSADDPLKAALLTVPQLANVGLNVLRVDRDLVDASEIAARLNRTRQNVQQWATGARKTDFPPPVSSIAGRRIWEWADVVEWAIEQGLTDLPRALSHADAVMVDQAILHSHEVSRVRGELSWSHPTHISSLHGGGHKTATTYNRFRQSDLLKLA